MGAIIVDLEKSKQEELYSFGIDLGILFQIQDDILDITHSDQEAGKTTNNDEDKNSFVKLLGLEGSLSEADKLADSLRSRLNGFDESLREKLEPILAKYLYRHTK
jgi:farnesyl diphosphate synthase